MPIELKSAALRRVAPALLADGKLTAVEARTLLAAAQRAGANQRVRADVRDIVAAHGSSLPAAERDALLAFIARAPVSAPVSSMVTARTARVVGPEDPARVGDLVQAPKITWSPSDVVRGLDALNAKLAIDPDLKARLRTQPFPSAPAQQLEWALAYELSDDKLSDPLWHTATNDSSAAATRYVHGVVAAKRAALDLVKIEERVTNAEAAFMQKLALDPTLVSRVDQMPFPSSPSEQLEWAVALQFAWDPETHPAVRTDPRARAALDLVGGVFALRANNRDQTPVVSERKTFDVDGDTRMYAVHTPPGPKPANGWPTVVFFHGSYGGHAPEQQDSYQQMNAVADRQGFQVLYLVGTPQDRNDSQTGRGMLNWDPVGAGPGGRNDRFVHELLGKLVKEGDVDKSRVIAAGHSQGGYYVSDLIAAYPDVFSGAAIFGAGAGSVMGALGPRGARETPTYLFVGKDDIHLQSGDDLARTLRSNGRGSALVYDSPQGRGHEVLASDYERMFAVLGAQTNASSPLGTTDGRSKTGVEAGTGGTGGTQGPVFRTHIDVNAPHAELARDVHAWNLVAQLAQNPWLNLDNDGARFTVDEWKQALRYLHTWPPVMQQQIAALRAHFVVAAPPRDAIDLSNTASPIWADHDMARAAWLLHAEPAFDLDGYPGLVTRDEVDAALASASALQPDQVRGLHKLRAMFAPVAPGGARSKSTLPGGAKLEVYPNSDDAKRAITELVANLSASPVFARTLAKSTILVSPPGAGVDAIPEVGPHYASAEGVAMFAGPDGVSGPPTLVIRHDSITRWELGAAHEIIHLVMHDLGDAALAEAEAIRVSIKTPGTPEDDYANAHEMVAFFGQWHLAGYGSLIRAKSPALADFLERTLGTARIKDPGFGVDGARTSITSLFQWFQTGRR
jgi:poly(3-hydroxybutyrate) depolymerase